MAKERMKKFWEQVKINLLAIVKYSFVIMQFLFTVFSVFLLFVSWENLKISDVSIRIWILISIIVVSIICAFIYIMFIKKTKIVWKKGKKKATAIYGDLLKIGFKNKGDIKIVVIPVNDTFETIVDEPSENITSPLVSSNTIHGRWVKEFCKREGINKDELNERIQKSLKVHEEKPVRSYTKSEKPRGNKDSYKLGTVAIVNSKETKTIYFLLAISKFDENNNAHATKKEIRNSIDDLLEFYNNNGQNHPIFIPLVGTNMSRAGLKHDDSLRIIRSCVLAQGEDNVGDVNIVVYKGDKSEVTIF